jgi:hypothetical protein
MEKRLENFAFRVNEAERKAIRDLAERLKRNESDAVRYVVTAAARELEQLDGAKADGGQNGGSDGGA